MMFDVEVTSNITLSGLMFFAKSGMTDVTIYTATGRYANKQYNSSAWTQIYSSSFSIAQTWLYLQADFPDVSIRAESTRTFYIHSTGKHYAGGPKTGVTLASDGILKILNPSRATDTLFGGDYGSGLTWVGSLTYSINTPSLAPTMKPTNRPSKAAKTMRPSSPPTARK